MSDPTTSNMNLTLPGVGTTPGPDYATELNNNFSTIDSHDHTTGQGVQITVAGLNINANLPMNNHFITAAAGLTLQSQGSTPANKTVYASGNDLYYVNGSGFAVQITSGNSIVGTAGSISGLASPASATYSAPTFIWQSNTNIAANMDFGTATLRNISPNSTYGLTLAAPASLSSNYTVTLPSLPASQKIVTLDNSGNMTAPYTVDGSTITIATNVIGVPASGIGTTQLAASAVTTAKITDSSVTTAKVADSAITQVKLGAANYSISSSSGSFSVSTSAYADVTNLSMTFRNTNRPIIMMLQPDGGGGDAAISAGGSGCRIRFLQNGSPQAVFAYTSPGSLGTGCMCLIAPSPNNYTYSVQAASIDNSTPQGITNIKLVIYEL